MYLQHTYTCTHMHQTFSFYNKMQFRAHFLQNIFIHTRLKINHVQTLTALYRSISYVTKTTT